MLLLELFWARSIHMKPIFLNMVARSVLKVLENPAQSLAASRILQGLQLRVCQLICGKLTKLAIMIRSTRSVNSRTAEVLSIQMKRRRYSVRGTRLVPYPIPHDCPVGQFLKVVNRHTYRPAHLHFLVKKKGYDELITALYMKGDKYEGKDVVFGEKDELTIELKKFEDEDAANGYNCNVGDCYINFDIVLMTFDESQNVFNEKSDLVVMGILAQIIDGLPVADLD